MDSLDRLVESRKNTLYFYSPYNFIRQIPLHTHIQKIILPSIQMSDNLVKVFDISGCKYFFITRFLPWDSQFFNLRTYKLNYILFEKDTHLNLAVQRYQQYLSEELEAEYCFADVPSEDISVLQSLTANRFKLIETRLTYFHDKLQTYEYQRFKVREATEIDIPNLQRVASEMRNDYDRFHADAIFSEEIADNYLAKYVTESVRGFADVVLIPNEENVPSDGFLTAKYLQDDWELLETNVSKMILSAVSTTCRGWYVKLISEMTYLLREKGADYIFMNTQSTNRAVFRTWEKLNYRLGTTNHILSFNF